MAKQTFTTGQVLTAAQMTSLQQTAMGGGAATAKTASYVLVAADAGTTVAMNAAGATTITVNTGLFAAGDTVFIQNLGAGACTVTAGTATVATAGSLILPQNDAGILYFTATGASIFYDYIQAGAVSPLTTKGDLYGFSTLDARIPIGANGTLLTADSTESLGLKWAAPAGSTFVGAMAFRASGQTLTNNTQTTMNFTSEQYDTNGFHDNSTNPNRLTIPAGKTGYYLVNLFIAFEGNASGTRSSAIYLDTGDLYCNATVPAADATFGTSIFSSAVIYLTAAQYVEARVTQRSGGNLNTSSGIYAANFSIAFLGA